MKKTAAIGTRHYSTFWQKNLLSVGCELSGAARFLPLCGLPPCLLPCLPPPGALPGAPASTAAITWLALGLGLGLGLGM